MLMLVSLSLIWFEVVAIYLCCEIFFGTGLEHLKFRSVYISREGYSFMAADFKHIECRVFAHAAADKELEHALTSDDLFRVLTAKW